MHRYLAKFGFRLFGWRTDGHIPPGIEKGVIIYAPHTSAWDFIVGRFTLMIARVPLKVLIKKESFFFPLGPVLKLLGAVPVDRGNKKNNLVDGIVDQFNRNDRLFIVITPEGSRKLVKKWKKGFYQIAMKANVPIILAYIDYREKTGGIGPILYPTGDYEKDMMFIYSFYKTKTPKYPELFYLPDELK